MNDSAQLEVTVSDLRKRMAEAGCVFKFIVSSVADGVEVSQSDHRDALERLFSRLDQEFWQHHLDTIARDPSLETWQFFTLEFEVSRATATLIDALEVNADGSSWLQRLGEDFLEWGKRPDATLFATFCAVVGLGSDAVVMDWIGDEDAQPERSAWSNYFVEGDCFGNWCATIWNPKTRTLSAIVANQV